MRLSIAFLAITQLLVLSDALGGDFGFAPDDTKLLSRKMMKEKPTSSVIDGQYIIILREQDGEKDNQKLAAKAQSLITGTEATVTRIYDSVFRGFVVTGMSVDEAAVIAVDPQVKLIENDQVANINAVESWGLDRIDERDLPLDSIYSPSFDKKGAGVTAYIIDTGIMSSHADFGGRATFGYNSAGDGKDYDCHGHGTHVAGTVGGTKYGVAKNVKLVGVKVLSCSGSGTWSGVIAGINYIMENAEMPATANMSLGGGKSRALNAAVKALVASGVTIAVAAGNSMSNACSYSPASEPTAITVGSTDNNDQRSSYSNFGTCVDIFAPGRNIKSAYIGGNTNSRNLSGTSMASPHVCGAAALHLGNNPNLTTFEISSLVLSSSTPSKVTSAGTGSPNRLLFVGSTGGGGGGCTDEPGGWYDSDGPAFNCDWYSSKNFCAIYGNGYARLGKTANQACCVCGGGTNSVANEYCVDSPLLGKMTTMTAEGEEQFKWKSCSWVSQNTKKRCNISGASKHCPYTCEVCPSCVDSSLRFEVPVEGETSNKITCEWVKRMDKQTRCKIGGISDTCRETCGKC